MKEFLERAWSDLQQRKNIELYLTLGATIAIFVVELFGIQSSAMMFNVILGILGVLIYYLIEDRHFNEKQEKVLDELRTFSMDSTFFTEWDSSKLTEQLKRAKEFSGVYVANYEFLRRHYDILKELLIRGGTIKLLYINPESFVVNMVLEWPENSQEDKESLQSRLQLTYQLLQGLSKFASNKEQIQVKLLDRMPPLIFTILDEKQNAGTIYATINGFQVSHGMRPSFSLSHTKDKKWFDFFAETFNNLWQSHDAVNVNLGGKSVLQVEKTNTDV